MFQNVQSPYGMITVLLELRGSLSQEVSLRALSMQKITEPQLRLKDVRYAGTSNIAHF